MDYTFLREMVAILVSAVIIGGVTALFFKFASSKVKVTVRNQSITFQNEKGKIELEPYLFISSERKRNRILSVGESSIHGDQKYKVDLINYKKLEGDKLTYEDYLSVFLRYGFNKLLNRKILAFTKVTFCGAEIIQQSLTIDCNKKIRKALKNAGAIECHIT